MGTVDAGKLATRSRLCKLRCPHYTVMNTNWPLSFRVLLAVSLIAIAFPYILVVIEQASGLLASQQEWEAQGHEFGPWRGRWEGFTIFFPSLVLAPIVVLIAAGIAVLERRWRPLPGAIGLFGLHVAALLLQQLTLVWLIA